VVPVLGIVTVAIGVFMQNAGLIVVPANWWLAIGTYPTLFLAEFLGDFIGYWRHRLEHTKWLWPTHAIHHSDEEMTWLTLNRFHPINRITTVIIDSTFLVAMGLPAWAVIANSLVRNYYGYFIHADLPWTYGPLGKVFVSPAMHQGHQILRHELCDRVLDLRSRVRHLRPARTVRRAARHRPGHRRQRPAATGASV
jgi:sterol desaturase/sphingolipid hydroxylase (fatty acid hydroxylase superfamily)